MSINDLFAAVTVVIVGDAVGYFCNENHFNTPSFSASIYAKISLISDCNPSDSCPSFIISSSFFI